MIDANRFVDQLAMRIAAGFDRQRAVAFRDMRHAVRSPC